MVILPAYYAASLNTDQGQVLQYLIDICQGLPMSYQAKETCELSHSIIDLVSDTNFAVQFPSECRRPGYLVGSYSYSHETGTQLVWCQTDVSRAAVTLLSLFWPSLTCRQMRWQHCQVASSEGRYFRGPVYLER